jgi:hypothetical protein
MIRIFKIIIGLINLFIKYGVKGWSPLWGPGAKPLVGSKGEALVGAADCCKGIKFSNFVENGALNSTLNCPYY